MSFHIFLKTPMQCVDVIVYNPIFTLPWGPLYVLCGHSCGGEKSSLCTLARLCHVYTRLSIRTHTYILFFLNQIWTASPVNSFSLTFYIFSLQGARSWPRELTCASSMWSTQRAERASCSASRRTRRGSWRPRPRTPGWSSSARYAAPHSKPAHFHSGLCVLIKHVIILYFPPVCMIRWECC